MLVAPLHHPKTPGASGETAECHNNFKEEGGVSSFPQSILQPSGRGEETDNAQQENVHVVTYKITVLTLFKDLTGPNEETNGKMVFRSG